MNLQQITAIVLLLSMMFNAGLQMNRPEILAVFKNYGLLLRALFANFIVVPLAALLLTTVLHVNDLVATGVLLMAIAPGVPFVILAGGREKGGSHELAVTLALILPVLSFVTIPITAQLVLPAAERVAVPPGQLFSLLLFQVAPLALGIVVRAFAPAVAETLKRPLGRITYISFIALLAILAPSVARAVLLIFGSLGILAIIGIDVISLASGWVLGGPNREERFTLAIGTALRNPGLAMVIATARFPEATVAASVSTYFLIQFVGVVLFGGRVLSARAESRAARS
jgi:BASS family bile acid:Na+ symporter